MRKWRELGGGGPDASVVSRALSEVGRITENAVMTIEVSMRLSLIANE